MNAIPWVPNLNLALEKALRKQDDSWDESKIHASDLSVAIPISDGGKCHRQLFLRLSGAEKKPPTIGQMLMWDHGKRIEERIRYLIMGYLGLGWELLDEPDKERVVSLPHGITGEYDGKLIHKEGWELILDYKTSRGRAFRFLSETGPKGGHVPQIRSYIMAEEAHGGVLWYLDREGQNTPQQFFETRDDETVKKSIPVALAVAERKEPPPVLLPKVSSRQNKNNIALIIKMPWQCDYCDYLDVSCQGALPPKLRSSSGLVGGHVKGKEVSVVEKFSDYESIIMEEGELVSIQEIIGRTAGVESS